MEIFNTHCPICNNTRNVERINDTSFKCIHCNNTINSLIPITYIPESSPHPNKTAKAILEAYIKGEDIEAFIRKHYNIN